MKVLFVLILFLVSFSQRSFASLTSNTDFSEKEKIERSVFSGRVRGGIYKFKQNAIVPTTRVIMNGVEETSDLPVDLNFSRGEPIAVLIGENGNALVSLIVAEAERGGVPEKIFLSAQEFEKLDLEFFSEGDEVVLYSQFNEFEDTEFASLKKGKARSRMHWRGTGGCVAYVLSHLGFVVRGNGKDISRALRTQKGWSKVSCENPPVGAVASWTGGNHGRGHTGIWNGSCFKYDIACGDPGHKYHLIECVAP